jgi:hypothetical protein
MKTCAVDGCDGKFLAKGLCRRHYNRVYSGREVGGPERLTRPSGTPCSVEGCDRPGHNGFGLCGKHYQRLKAKGSTEGPPTAWERILRRVELDGSGCWLWPGAVAGHGYGVIGKDARQTYTHRVAYEAEKGPIPEGFQIDHLCCVITCCNPDHLEVVTPAENRRRQAQAQMGV